MTGLQWLETIANVGAIVTAVITALVSSWYFHQRCQKRLRLENYLKAQKDAGANKGQRTVMHLVAALGMTEAEIVDAAFRSGHIERKVTVDQDGAASRLLLEYSAKKSN